MTSAFAVPAAAGVPVTHRGLSTSVTVVTGQVGDPTRPGGVDWESLARAGGTLVVLMGVATRAEIARRLLAGRPAGRHPGGGGRVGDHGPASAPCAPPWPAGRRRAGGQPGRHRRRGRWPASIWPPRRPRPWPAGRWWSPGPATRPRPWPACSSRPGARVLGGPGHRDRRPRRRRRPPWPAAADPGGRHYDWVAFTSANAVHRLRPAAAGRPGLARPDPPGRRRGRPPPPPWPSYRLAGRPGARRWPPGPAWPPPSSRRRRAAGSSFPGPRRPGTCPAGLGPRAGRSTRWSPTARWPPPRHGPSRRAAWPRPTP